MPLEYLHEQVSKSIVGDTVVIHEEQVVHGDKGFRINFYHKEKGHKMKVTVSAKNPGEYVMRRMEDDKPAEEKKLSKAELVKELKADKNLKFAVEYVQSAKTLARSKAGSKKGSRKGSRKSSRK